MLKAIFKPLSAYLLCVLIVVASVDRVPDPPVLKPHHDRAAKLCLDSQHQAAPDLNLTVEQISFHPAFRMPAFAWDIHCESRQRPRSVILRHQASDSSPPVSAA